MSSSTAATTDKIEWLVILPDKKGVFEKRMAVREQHLEAALDREKKGLFKMGGAMLNTPPIPDKPLDFAGSCLIAYAATKEEVLKVVNEDIYAKTGVWDLEKMAIYPFKTAFRQAS